MQDYQKEGFYLKKSDKRFIQKEISKFEFGKMGRDFYSEICPSDCECEIYNLCKCRKIGFSQLDLRNNSSVYELLRVGEEYVRFSYDQIEEIVIEKISKLDKMELFLRSIDDNCWHYGDEWPLLLELGHILAKMEEESSKTSSKI